MALLFHPEIFFVGCWLNPCYAHAKNEWRKRARPIVRTVWTIEEGSRCGPPISSSPHGMQRNGRKVGRLCANACCWAAFIRNKNYKDLSIMETERVSDWEREKEKKASWVDGWDWIESRLEKYNSMTACMACSEIETKGKISMFPWQSLRQKLFFIHILKKKALQKKIKVVIWKEIVFVTNNHSFFQSSKPCI